MKTKWRLLGWAAAFLFVVCAAVLHVRGLVMAPHIGATWTRTTEGHFLITAIDAEGPARQSGLAAGDVIAEINGRRADHSLILTDRTLPIGAPAALSLQRGLTSLNLTIVPTSRWLAFEAEMLLRLLMAASVVLVSWITWFGMRSKSQAGVLLVYACATATGLNGHLLFSSLPGALAGAMMLASMPLAAGLLLEMFSYLIVPIERLWRIRVHTFAALTGMIAALVHIIRFIHPSLETRSWWGATVGFSFIFVSLCQLFVLWRTFQATLSPDTNRTTVVLFALALVGSMVPYINPSFLEIESSATNVLLTVAPLFAVTIFSVLIRRKG